MRFELGLEEPDPKRAVRSAATIAASYIAGGLIPLAPYILAARASTALPYSVVATIAALRDFWLREGPLHRAAASAERDPHDRYRRTGRRSRLHNRPPDQLKTVPRFWNSGPPGDAIPLTGTMLKFERTLARDLLTRFRAGDRDAFTEIYREHHRAVFRFALLMTADRGKATDVTQDVFVWLIHHPDKFDPARGELGAFLIGVARKFLKHLYAEEQRSVPLEESSLESPAESAGEGEEDLTRLRQAIAALPPRYREVVALCDLQEKNVRGGVRHHRVRRGDGSIQTAPRASAAGAQADRKSVGTRMSRMSEKNRWEAAVSRMAAESRNAAPSPDLEALLLGEFDRTRRNRRVRPFLAVGAAAAAVAGLWFVRPQPAASLQISLAKPEAPWSALAGPQIAAPRVSEPAPARSPIRPVPAEQPFFPIPYVTPLDPYERAEVVRMELPVSALIAAGVPIDTDDAGANVQADVVVGQDGRARAVRLVSISRFDE